METNETILTRKIVGLDDRKTLGKMNDVRVDCDTLGVSHYIVTSASTNSALVLPFDKAMAVGDTFVTIQGRGDFLPTSNEALGIVNDGFKLVGVEVYSKTGNRLGVVASYGFDPVFGTVTELVLDSGETFSNDQFVFFASEFVFVDNGERTAAELRDEDAAAAEPEPDAEASVGEVPVEEEPAEEEAVESAEVQEEVVQVEEVSHEEAVMKDGAEDAAAAEAEAGAEDAEPAEYAAPIDVAQLFTESEAAEAALPLVGAETAPAEDEAAEAAEDAAADDDEDAELVAFLLGQTTTEDVASSDGAFAVSKGTVLTSKIIEDARAHGALLLLTMSVDA